MKKFFFIFVIFILALSLRLWNLNAMGRTWDEEGYVDEGYTFVQLFKQHDFNNFSWYEFPDHPPLAKYLYGIGAQFDYLNSAHGKPVFTYDFTYARIVSVLFSSLTAVLILLIGWRYFSLIVGVTGAIIFSFLPLSIAYGQLVSLESIRLFFYTLSLFLFFLFLENPTKKNIFLTGLSLGCALEVKQPEILLYPLFLFIIFFWYKSKGKKQINIGSYIKKIFIIFLISFLTFFLLWPMPWFHLDYVIAFTHNLWFSTLGKSAIPEVFFGRLMLVPKLYYIAYFVITTPLLILILFFIGLLVINKQHIFKQKHWIGYSMVLAFVFPFFLSFYSLQQHGIRYIIEIYTPLSLISAIGFKAVLDQISGKVKGYIIGLVLLIGYLFFTIVTLSPYYLTYFNEISGGTQYVYSQRLFQMGWWGDGLREAGNYVKDNAPKGSKIGLAISPDHVLLRSNGLTYGSWDPKKRYDYVIVNYYHIIRDKFNDHQVQKDYRLVHTVGSGGMVLAFIYKHK